MPYQSDFIDYSVGKRNVVIQRDFEAQEKMQEEMLKSYTKYLSEKEREENKFYEEVRRLREIGEDDSVALARYRKSVKEREKAEQELADAKENIQEELNRKVEIASRNAYNKMSARERREYSKDVSEKIKKQLDSWDVVERRHKAHIDKLKEDAASKTGDDKIQAEKKIAQMEADFAVQKDILIRQQKEAEELSRGFMQSSVGKGVNLINDKFGVNLNRSDRIQASEAANKNYEEKAKVVTDHYEEQEELKQKIRDAEAKGDKEEMERLEKERRAKQEAFEESGAIEQAEDAKIAAWKESGKVAIAETIDSLGRGMDNLIDDFKSSMADAKRIDEYIDNIFGDQAKYLAKLEGSNEKWRKSVDHVSDAIGFSGLVKKTSVISKMKELVDSGIAYNIELRAFLAETSENIASTFEVTNGTLLRMIRIQQQDSTAARLGMEATLTRLFNKFFEDTTYLKDVADDISSSILDASATMTKNMSLEFEYNVQKWLGALYSLGVSSSAVQKIAEGVNYLGTGNVSALNSNSSLQTLFAMSASRAGGKSYAEMLSSGLTSEDTNKLLKAMIEYLAQIADSQSNMVTKSAYAELFGMSVTDLSIFANLTNKEIKSLYKDTVSYKSLMRETSDRLSKISKNMSITELVDNAIDNATAGVATTIGKRAITYGTWKALNLLKEYVGEIKVPGIIGFGTGISSGLDLLNLAQTVMVGIGMVGSLTGGLGSMLSGGPTNLNNWDFNKFTKRGRKLQILDILDVLNKDGSYSDTSYSAVIGVGSASSSDMESVSMESGTEQGLEAAGTTSEELQEQKETPQKIYDVLAGDQKPNILSLLQEIDERLSPDRVFYTAISGIASTDTVNTISSLSSQIAVTSVSSASNSNMPDSSASSTSSSSSSGISGQGSSSDESNSENMSDIIAAAVAEAIRNAISSYGFSGVPVNVTNGG